MSDTHWLRRDATIALSYLRLSGVEDDELSPDLQLRSILRHIRSLGLDADAHIEQDTITGEDVYADITKGMHSAFKRDNMPAWLQLIERARRDTRVAAVVAYDLSRAFRQIMAMLEETKLLNSFGVHLILNGQIVNLEDPHQWAQWVDQAKHAEFESRITTWRLKSHYNEMRDLGINYSHVAPLGVRRTGKRHKVKWETTEDFKTILLLCELYSKEDIGSPNLARELNLRGATWINRKGKRGSVKPTTVRNTINTIEKYREFLPADLYANVLRVRAARSNRKGNGPRTKHPPMLLLRLVHCARCGSRHTTNQGIHFTTGAASKAKLPRPVYVHSPQHQACNSSPKWVSAKVLHEQFWARLAPLATLSDSDKTEIAERMMQPATSSVLDTRHAREKLLLQLRNLENAYLNEDFGRLDEARPYYRQRRRELEKQLAELPAPVTIAPQRFASEEDARVWLDELVETLMLSESLAPEQANRFLRSLFLKVEVDGAEVKKLKYHPDLEGWLPPL